LLGDANDFQIFHNGADSYLFDNGTGDLNLTTNGASINLKKHSGGENMLVAVPDGSVSLYHNNSKKFETTSAGVDVTGTVTSSGLVAVENGSTTGTYGFRHEGAGKYFQVGVPNNSFTYFQTDTNGGFNFEADVRVSGDIVATGDVSAVNFNSTSDATLKTNVETLTGSLDAVKSLRGVSFDWLENGGSEIGVIAQEVEDVLPDVVNTNEDGIKSVKYGNIVAVLIEAMKEQQAQIDELKTQINS